MASAAVPQSASNESNGRIAVSIALVVTLIALIILISWFMQRGQGLTITTFTPTGHPYMLETRQRKGIESFMLGSIPIVKYGTVLRRNEQIRVAEESHSPSYVNPLRREIQSKYISRESAALATIENEGGDPPIKDPSVPNSNKKIPAKMQTIQNRDESRPNHGPASCSICIEDFLDWEDVRILPCAHIYHQRCIDSWVLDFSGTCPLW